MSLSDDTQADINEAFDSTSRSSNDLLNIDNYYFKGMVAHFLPTELQVNKDHSTDTEVSFLDLHLSISNGLVSSIKYDKRDDSDFDIFYFPIFG